MLDISRLMKVSVDLSPSGAQVRSFGRLLVAGDSAIISGLERIRNYSSIESVAADFGLNAPEYKAAVLYFEQVPQPAQFSIARYIPSAISGFLKGGVLTATEQGLANFTGITNGAFKISINGSLQSLSGLNFSAATSMTDIVNVINGVLTGAVASFSANRFVITSSTTGASSAVSYATSPVSGTDMSAQLKLTSSLASVPVPGYAAETPVQCAATLALMSSSWYGLQFASTASITDDQHVDVANFIEALTIKRIYGITIQNAQALDPQVTSDLGSRLKALLLKRTFYQYSSKSAYAIASFFGRAFSVDFTRQNATINLMYKQEPGVEAEDLNDNEANALQDKNYNVFVKYNNDTQIIQYGVMASGEKFDNIHGLDWFQNQVQTNGYNLLYTSPTKIPQTDGGVNQLVAAIQQACDQAVFNGLIAPGTWTGPAIGQILTGQFLKSGYYIFAASLASQSQADRAARKAPPITIAIKLAGAIESMDALVLVNR